MSVPRSYLAQLEKALDDLTDFAGIERAGQMLASDIYGTLVPVGGTHDLGREQYARAKRREQDDEYRRAECVPRTAQ